MLLLLMALSAAPNGWGLAAADGAPLVFTVSLRAQATVKNSSLILADVADLSGEDEAQLAQLARTPLGSVADVRLLSRSEILAMIRSCFPKSDDVLMTGADFARVSLMTRRPEAAEIAAVLRAHLASVSRWREEEIEIRAIDNLKSLELPQGEVQLRVAGRTMPANFESALIPMEALMAGKAVRTFWVKADVRVRARVVQLANPVPYRGTLRPEDLYESLCDIRDPHAEHLRTIGEAAGLTAKRALKTGDLLLRDWLSESQLVRSGETVRLTEQSGIISITVLARALQNGKLGDRIKVKNIDSDRLLAAVITGRGEARVAR